MLRFETCCFVAQRGDVHFVPLGEYITVENAGQRASLADRARAGRAITIFGDGQQTRDFVYVGDVADVNLWFWENGVSGIFNLGTGRGYSVLELVKAYEQASGRPVPYDIVARRPGDVAACYADPALAQRLLGWRAQRGLDAMCADSWRWQSMNPHGFEPAHSQ